VTVKQPSKPSKTLVSAEKVSKIGATLEVELTEQQLDEVAGGNDDVIVGLGSSGESKNKGTSSGHGNSIEIEKFSF
jgi:hypothetical protein